MPRRLTRLAALALGGVGLISTLAACNTTSDADIVFTTLEEVRSLGERQERTQNTLLLIDPRPPSDFSRGHIPGARNIQQSMVMRDSDLNPKWDEYDTIIVYGTNRASPPARAMTKRLIEVGYDDVFMYEGGFEEWLAAGMPVDIGLSDENAPRKPAQRSSRE
jgi:rhodanese-related sulfurtransferase